MAGNKNLIRPIKRLLVMSAVAAMLCCTGCCKKNSSRTLHSPGTRKPTRALSPLEPQTAAIEVSEPSALLEREFPEREKDRRTQQLYQRFELSFELYQKENFDGALREVERIQMEINDDLYLEMQTWYLSAMIYHKTAKSSRRNRAMNKMLAAMEKLQEDPKFLASFEEGMMSQELIDLALSRGKERHDE